MSQQDRTTPLDFSEDSASFDPLEDLFAEAQAAAAADKTVPRKRRSTTDAGMANALAATARRMKETYTLPENWQATRGIALIHSPSGTLIGNYQEYLHRTVPGCRKLERVHGPLQVQGTERVEGEHWLEEHFRERIEQAATWHAKREAIVDLWFPELGLGSPATEVVAFISFGGIARVELVEHTQFFSPGGETILTIPAGTNVLEVLGLDSKLALRAELAL